MARTREIGQIAAFIPYPQTTRVETVIISRGSREGVEKGSLYFVLSNDDMGEEVALLKVFNVKEKMAQAKPLWVSAGCPILKRGWKVFLCNQIFNKEIGK